MEPKFIKKYKSWLVLLSFTMFLLLMGFNDNSPSQSTGNIPKTEDTTDWPRTFGFGRTATKAEISALDISIRPDGRGLPPGSGDVVSGAQVYDKKCMACHGKSGTEGPFSVLVGAIGDSTKAKTIGNYWPYATTLFDYIRRAMPFNQPGSLTNNEVYSVTAYLLYKNRITGQSTVLNAASLPLIKMPARDLFVNDDRHGGPEIK